MLRLGQLPKFFLDRSLGRKAVPEALRAAGWDLVTLADHYEFLRTNRLPTRSGSRKPQGEAGLFS